MDSGSRHGSRKLDASLASIAEDESDTPQNRPPQRPSLTRRASSRKGFDTGLSRDTMRTIHRMASMNKSLRAEELFNDSNDITEQPFDPEDNFGSSQGVVVLQEKRMTLQEINPIIVKNDQSALNQSPWRFCLYFVDGIAKPLLTDEKSGVFQTIDGTFRAFGQVVFCNNPFSGAFILVAMLFSNWRSGACAFYCTLLTNSIATIFGVEPGLVYHGLLGYNAVLVGAGISTFLTFEPQGLEFLVATIGAPVILITHLAIARFLAQYGSAALTFPFNIVMMSTLLSATAWVGTSRTSFEAANNEHYLIFDSVFNGIAQIFIIEDPISGVIIFFGMLLCSRVLAVGCLIGSVLGSILSLVIFDASFATLNAGLAGYNCALSLPAILFFLVPSPSSPLLSLLNVLMTLGAETVLNSILSTWSIPYMTLPFCIATVPFLFVDSESICINEKPLVEVITLTDLTAPEEHYMRFAKWTPYCTKRTPTEVTNEEEEEDDEK